jgi:pentatricopeptide repeat protein
VCWNHLLTLTRRNMSSRVENHFQNGEWDLGMKVLEETVEKDIDTFQKPFQWCIENKRPKEADKIRGLAKKHNIELDHDYHVLTMKFSSKHTVKQMLKVFSELKQRFGVDRVTKEIWLILFQAICIQNTIKEACIFVLENLEDINVKMDVNMLLKMIAPVIRTPTFTMEFPETLVKCATFELNETIWGAMIDGYLIRDNEDNAEGVYSIMPNPDLNTYSHFIKYYCKKDNFAKVEYFLEMMKNDQIVHSEGTLEPLLKMYVRGDKKDLFWDLYDQCKISQTSNSFYLTTISSGLSKFRMHREFGHFLADCYALDVLALEPLRRDGFWELMALSLCRLRNTDLRMMIRTTRLASFQERFFSFLFKHLFAKLGKTKSLEFYAAIDLQVDLDGIKIIMDRLLQEKRFHGVLLYYDTLSQKFQQNDEIVARVYFASLQDNRTEYAQKLKETYPNNTLLTNKI